MHIIHREEYGTIGIRGDTRRNLDPVTAYMAVGLGSSLLGGIFGGSSQKETNKTNLQIARETNEQNYKIWQEQKAHNIDMFNMENQANIDMFNMENQAAIDMWNMQNAYNDPSAQAERLLKAGYNPLMTLGSSAAGNATSAPSVGSLNSATAQPAQAPTMQNPAPITSPFQTAWNNAMQGVQIMVESISKAALTQPTIDNLKAGTNFATQQAVKTHFDAKASEAYSKYAPTIFAEQAESLKYDNDMKSIDALYYRQTKGLQVSMMQAQLTYMGLSNERQQILNSFLPGEKQLDMITKGVQIAHGVLQNKFLEKDLENYYTRYLMVNIAQASLLRSQKKGQDIANNSAQMDYDMKKAFYDGLQSETDSKGVPALKSLGKALAQQSLFNAYLQDMWVNPTREIEATYNYEQTKRYKTGFLGDLYGTFDTASKYVPFSKFFGK